MKKILIAYASNTGTTAACARRLADCLDTHEVTLCDLTEQMPTDISEYDFVAVGSCIRFGKLHKRVAAFVDEFSPALSKTAAGYFICCGYTDSTEEYLYKNIPGKLLDTAQIYCGFGGELNVRKQKNFFDRMIVRLVRNSVLDDGAHDGEMRTANLPSINPDSISRFAGAIKKSFEK